MVLLKFTFRRRATASLCTSLIYTVPRKRIFFDTSIKIEIFTLGGAYMVFCIKAQIRIYKNNEKLLTLILCSIFKLTECRLLFGFIEISRIFFFIYIFT